MTNNQVKGLSRRKFLEGVGASAIAGVAAGATTKDAAPVTLGVGEPINLPLGQAPYIVASPRSDLDRRVLGRLTSYLEATLRRRPRVLTDLSRVPGNSPAIVLARAGESSAENLTPPAGSAEGFVLATRKVGQRSVVFAVGNSDRGLKRAIQKLIINSHQSEAGLHIPVLKLSAKPWITEREWAVCPWVPRYVRGVFVNPYADQRLNIWLYSDEQIAQYVEMYDWFGFSGVQLMETSYSYGVLGSVGAFHARLKEFARQARDNGQRVSLWVWAAEFSQFNWIDPDVTYTPARGLTAFDDPKVRRGFEKYYDYYAGLAPYVDRLMAHYYDPGNLTDPQDVFKYMRLLENKFRAKNPRIELAVDLWAAHPDYFAQLVHNGFKDYLILESPHGLKPAQRETLHQEAKRLGLKLGMWDWYSTGYETDQLASMYVNCQVLKEFYQQIKNGAASIYPYQYWSEMEAHHLNNIYSQYVASQLLWDPDRDPHEILGEFTEAIWGPSSGKKVYEALRLIEDVRSGQSWNTYWWREPGYRLGTKNPAEDLQRAELALSELENLEADRSFAPKLPLPFPSRTFVELMLPQLREIRAFAQFRINLSEVEAAARNGTSKSVIAQHLTEIWKPIPEYDTWIGTFGQIERRMQEILVERFAKETGVQVDPPAWLRAEDSDRLLQKIQNVQLGKHGEWQFKAKQLNEFWWPEDKLQDRLEKLVAEGWVEKLPDNTYRLANWDYYAR